MKVRTALRVLVHLAGTTVFACMIAVPFSPTLSYALVVLQWSMLTLGVLLLIIGGLSLIYEKQFEAFVSKGLYRSGEESKVAQEEEGK